jgi:hypothetical protein
VSRAFCPGCWEKQRTIDQLREENQRLKAQVRYRERQAMEGAFGSSTPSARRPLKANSGPEHQGRKGGAKRGHPGHGRTALPHSRHQAHLRQPGDPAWRPTVDSQPAVGT